MQGIGARILGIRNGYHSAVRGLLEYCKVWVFFGTKPETIEEKKFFFRVRYFAFVCLRTSVYFFET